MGNAGEQPTNGLHGGRKNIPPQGPFGVLFRLWENGSFVPHRQKTHQAEGLNRRPRVYRIDLGRVGGSRKRTDFGLHRRCRPRETNPSFYVLSERSQEATEDPKRPPPPNTIRHTKKGPPQPQMEQNGTQTTTTGGGPRNVETPQNTHPKKEERPSSPRSICTTGKRPTHDQP